MWITRVFYVDNSQFSVDNYVDKFLHCLWITFDILRLMWISFELSTRYPHSYPHVIHIFYIDFCCQLRDFFELSTLSTPPTTTTAKYIHIIYT